MMSSSGKQIYDDRLLTRYLLGVLPAEEAERLDELSIADEEFVWRLHGIENDLVDAYVRGKLSGEDLQQFKAFYLSSPKRRLKVEFAEGLLALEHKAAALPAKAKEGTAPGPGRKEEPSEPFPWRLFSSPRFAFRRGFAGAALAVLAVGGYLLSENLRLRKQMTEAQAQHASRDQRMQALEQQLNHERSAKAEVLKELERARESQTNLDQLKTLSFLLPPPTRGTSRVATISLRGADLVVLILALESDDFPAYRVSLKDPATNQVLWRSTKLEAASGGDKKAVSVCFRASLLKQQNYIAELTGIPIHGAAELVGGYGFRAVLQ
jgi:hypothetical protein